LIDHPGRGCTGGTPEASRLLRGESRMTAR
jgi:hypothetical protein